MYKSIVSLTTAAVLSSVVLHSQSPYIPPEPATQPYAKDYVFVTNDGQLTDTDGSEVNAINYYTHSNTPLTFFQQGKISFAHLDRPDTVEHAWYRVDMEFLCEQESGCTPTVSAIDQTGFRYHYFLENTGATGTTGVKSYQRLVYEGVFPGIDVHFYSNVLGPKMAIVLHENADPGGIRVQFTGQDSLESLNSGLRAYLDAWELDIPNMLAYEVDGNEDIYLKSWAAQWIHDGNGEVNVSLGDYNSANKLVLLAAIPLPSASETRAPENNEWSTFIGGFGDFDQINSVVTDDTNNAYICGMTGSPDFPINPGKNVFDPEHTWWTDIIVSKFDSDGRLIWTTFIGGGADEEGRALALDTNNNLVFTAVSSSHDLPLECTGGGRYCKTFAEPQYMGEYDAYVGILKNAGDTLRYASYYGDTLDDWPCINCLYVDSMNNFHFGGHTGGAFPTHATGNAFLQTSLNLGNGFIVKMNNGVRLWSTLYGSDQSDAVNTLTGLPDGTIFVGGYTSGSAGNNLCAEPGNGGFPLCDVSGSADYYQSAPAGGFVSRFNTSGELTWSTFFGSPASEAAGTVYSLETSPEGYLYFAALADSGAIDASDCDAPSTNGVPLCYRTGAYMDSTISGPADLLIGRFDPQLGYDWGTPFGGTEGEVPWDIELSADGHLYLTGRTGSFDFPHAFKYGFYYKDYKSDSDPQRTDAFVIGFDSSGAYQWGTYYGATFTANQEPSYYRQRETAYGLAMDGSDKLYIVGITPSSGFTYECDPNIQYCRNTPSVAVNDLDDGFIVRFDVSEILGIEDVRTTLPALEVYPNPTQREIWVNLPADMQGKRVLQVMALDGRSVMNQSLPPRQNNIRLDFSSLPPGVYIVSVHNGQDRVNARLVKH